MEQKMQIEFYFVEGSWTVRLGMTFWIKWDPLVSVTAGNAAETGVATASDVVFVSTVVPDCDDYDAVINPDRRSV